MPEFLFSFFRTILFEFPFYFAGSGKKILSSILFTVCINGFTLPLAFAFILDRNWSWWSMEFIVALTEGLFFFFAFRKSFWFSLLIGFLANASSAFLGYFARVYFF